MNFVKTSTLLRTARRRTDGSELVQYNPPQVVTSWSNEYVSLETAIARLTSAQLPPAGFQDSYTVSYALAAYFAVSVVGVISDTDILVTHLSIWPNIQASTQPAPILTSHGMQITGPLRDMELEIRREIDGILLRLSISGETGDLRDLNKPVTMDPAHDPAGLVAKRANGQFVRSDIQRLHGATVEYT